MQTAEVISAEAFEKLRTLDDLIREEARRLSVEHQRGNGPWLDGWRKFTLEGAYDNDSELVALRAAIRRGIEIGRAS